MKKTTIFVALLVVIHLLSAVKLTPSKHYSNTPARIHPYAQMFNTQQNRSLNTKSRSYSKLLVILVDFQEEVIDDPNTTGNGKFLLESDETYLYSIGSPPHDQNYYLQNLEALRYYYLAASQGSYNLEYDVYPKVAPAYTLPQTMGYYNPVGADGATFLARMEEYFRDSFELADSLSPEIDFSQYGHYMIIHAGSDWQHDVFYDTPSDIPSFFINVGEGKEAVVDNGTVLISSACNVPSTISQDFRTNTSGEQTIHSGYGALNSVIAHEFGHSLGMRDLYNVYNWKPMVGVFDIMDSGGSGVLVDLLQDGSLVMVEGALPVLPGAWSRTLLFADFYSANGYLKDIEDIDLFTPIPVSAVSSKQTGNNIKPQILKIPLSPTEYILVENRNVDPDGDGGTAVFATPDSRVILYPTPVGDPDNNPSYEYDYLLPSFQKADGSAVGGGILVWRINDDVIYSQGVTDSAGNWVSNFDNNSVNNRYSARGVEIIEADNLPDIGYDWSWYWTGTQYEYFHAKKPTLDGSGFFVNWSAENWKPVLSSTTLPPLTDSKGIGSQYWLSDIGHPGATTNVTVRSGFFDDTQIVDSADPGTTAGPVINSSFGTLDLPLLSSDSIQLLSYDDGSWNDLWGEFPWSSQPVSYPIITADQNGNGFRELVLVHGNAVELIEFSNDALQSVFINYPDLVSATPISLNDTLFVSTLAGLSSVRNDQVLNINQIQGIKRLGSFQGDVVALCSDLLYLVDSATLQIAIEIELPERFGRFEPVTFSAANSNDNMLFLMSDSGNIYKYQNSQLSRIFFNYSGNQPTQMGITWYSTGGYAINPTVFWASGTKIYAIKHDGTLLSGFPFDAYPLTFDPEEHVYALISYPKVYLYLPVEGRGHIAFNTADGIQWQLSLLADQAMQGSQLFMAPNDQETQVMNWYYTDPQGTTYIHTKLVSLMNFGIYWNGFRNDGSGSFFGMALYDETPQSPAFTAYVYPNPVRNSQYRIRVENLDQPLKLDLYDINATLIQSMTIAPNGILLRDILMDSSKLSSGVYLLNLQCGNTRKRLKFAVEK